MTDLERSSMLKALIVKDFNTVVSVRRKFKSKAAHKALNNLLYILTKTRNLL